MVEIGRADRDLRSKIEDILLEFAGLYNEVTTSDLQGIATVKADEIIKEIEEDTLSCSAKRIGTSLIITCDRKE